jgi:hypothetical protein
VSSEQPPSSLFYDLVDDAAMFPPGNAEPAAALRGHWAVKHGRHADCVGPLLVRDDRLTELVDAARPDPGRRPPNRLRPPVDVVVVGPAAPIEPPRHVSVVGVEQVWDGAPIEVGDSRLALEPVGLDAVEYLLATVGEARIEGAPVIAKFRTGGVTADAFPSEDDLAYCILGAYNAGVPFKLTAGLHHAVRHTGERSGFEHHGFLNVMVAVARCNAGADERAVAETLAVRDVEALADEIRSWSADDAVAVRSSFLSFGCCGVEDPIRDLLDLGLIGADADAEARP